MTVRQLFGAAAIGYATGAFSAGLVLLIFRDALIERALTRRADDLYAPMLRHQREHQQPGFVPAAVYQPDPPPRPRPADAAPVAPPAGPGPVNAGAARISLEQFPLPDNSERGTL